MTYLRHLLTSGTMAAVVVGAWGVTAPGRADATRPSVAAPPTYGQAAWSMPAGYRAVQLASIESQRAFLHAMADSMPERLYGHADNPGQRSFAGHVYHAAVANAQAVDRFIDGPDYVAPDEATATASRRASPLRI